MLRSHSQKNAQDPRKQPRRVGRITTSSARAYPGMHQRLDSNWKLESKDRPSTEHGQVGTAGASNKPRVGGRDQQRTGKTLKEKEGTHEFKEITLEKTDKTAEGKEMVHGRNGKTAEGEEEEPRVAGPAPLEVSANSLATAGRSASEEPTRPKESESGTAK